MTKKNVETFATVVTETFTLNEEVLRRQDFVLDDVMSFQRKIRHVV